jgi:hypothetical protein
VEIADEELAEEGSGYCLGRAGVKFFWEELVGGGLVGVGSWFSWNFLGVTSYFPTRPQKRVRMGHPKV